MNTYEVKMLIDGKYSDTMQIASELSEQELKERLTDGNKPTFMDNAKLVSIARK